MGKNGCDDDDDVWVKMVILVLSLLIRFICTLINDIFKKAKNTWTIAIDSSLAAEEMRFSADY